MIISFPEGIVEKCLRLEAAGNGLARVMISIPAIVKPGREFAAVVSLLDKNAMPLISKGEVLTLSSGGLDQKVIFPRGLTAVCRVDGLVQKAAGFFRMHAEIDGKVFVSNPALAADEDRLQILWGDPHIHTTVGDCHPERCRTRNLAYAVARHVYGLDFAAIADHVSWAPRGTAGKWYDNLAACELFNEQGEFSALYCYEASMKGGRGGDCNVYLRRSCRTYVDPWPEDLNIAGLCKKIEGDFFVVPHHTTRSGKHGEIPAEAYPGEKLVPVVEIHSKWGTSEYRGNPTPLLQVHPGPGYVQDLLAQGYRFGFIGGTDSHTSMTFCRWLETEAHQAQPGLTAVMAGENSRDAVWDAMQGRRCYAACGERILLDGVEFGGLAMGESGAMPESGKVRVRAGFAAESVIKTVEVIRNNKVIYSHSPEDWKGQIDWTDSNVGEAEEIKDFETGRPVVFYYIRVTAQDDARAWSSPSWFCVKVK